MSKYSNIAIGITIFLLIFIGVYFGVLHKYTLVRATPTPTATQQQSYTNGTYGFTLQYPNNLTQNAQPTFSFGGTPIFEVGFSRDAFPKTNYSEAVVIVAVTGDTKDCLTGIHEGGSLDQEQTINGVVFKKGATTGAGAGNFYDSTVYRAIHNDVCYELSSTIHTTNIGNYDPGTVTEFDKNLVEPTLDQVISGFKFTN